MKNETIRVCNSGITFSVFIPIIRLLAPLFLIQAWHFIDETEKPSSVVCRGEDVDWKGHLRYDITIPIFEQKRFLVFISQFSKDNSCKIDLNKSLN